MNFIDLLIIYLACGAPFGVHYFLQNRARIDSRSLWLKTFLSFLFWIFFAFLLLSRDKNFKRFLHEPGKPDSLDVRADETLQSYQKQFEKTLSESDLNISIYEFREITERYIGLTLVNSSEVSKVGEREQEIFRVSENKNVKLGAVCFMRRNRKRLFFHQTEARKDFLRLVEKLLDADTNRVRLEKSAIGIVEFLKDYEAQQSLEKMFASSLQSDSRRNVNLTEKDLWKTEIHKPLPIKPISVSLPIMSAAANSRKKD